MNFRPLHDRVLVRRVEGPEKTPGGIKIDGEELIIMKETDIMGIIAN
jgi:co-chaperonin GroES (HSP10)